MKNYLFLLAFLFVSATVFAVPQGDGSVDNPYLVTDASELNEIRNHPDAHYRLMNDIDLGDWLAENSPEEGWEPINGFTGSLDGNGFAVSGFWINRPSTDKVGLFGSISGGTIKRLGLLMADGKGVVGNNNVGAFVLKNALFRAARWKPKVLRQAAFWDIHPRTAWLSTL